MGSTLAGGKRTKESGDERDSHQSHGIAHDQTDCAGPARAEGHAERNLTCTSSDCLYQDSVETDGADNQAQSSEH
jgi:hypothetical protein